ncbi:riboflavin kinase isoform X1 [Oncorhynchus tshawytscha]|uniref:riboflavin kinase isoform X1 n=1 Tax=Oncorhynchus tshawytscha TaxID=74940 RepID=UPI001C3E751A|nr:riboflavin kinase isoform X1 [Oncorhynchus tshawytscha]
MYFLQDCSVFGQFLHELLAGEVDVCLHNKHGLDGRNSEPISCCCPYHSFGKTLSTGALLPANFTDSVLELLPGDISTGIYYGWACVDNGDIHKMVMSIGCNPYYNNAKKSMETHVIHTFKEDFYGQILSVVLVGYIRPERSYDSLDALIAAINHDIEEAKRKLDLPEHLKLKKDNFFIASASSSMTSSNKITKGH